MQPLVANRPDPAPSRTSYRLQRLWLTPIFRALLRTGIPAFGIMIGALVYLNSEERMEKAKLQISEIRAGIEARPEFMVNLMQIENASAEVAEDIREVVNVDFPISSFDLDLGAMRAMIEGLDAVARADLVTRPGGVLDIDIRERIPAIVWRSRSGLELLDADGHRVTGIAVRAERADLPLIAGMGADAAVAEALEILKTTAPIADRVRGLVRVGARRWNVVLDRDQTILLPEIDAVAALERVIALHHAHDILTRDLVLIDMRDARRPTLRLSTGAMEDFHKMRLQDHGDDA